MAASVVTLTVTETWVDKSRLHVKGTLAVGAGDYVAGGLTLSFNHADIKSSKVPDFVTILSRTGAVAAAYNFAYVPGATRDVGKLAIGDLATNADLAVAATPAAITGATIEIYAIFKKFI